MAGLLSRAACAGAVVALVAASGCAVRGPKFASRFVTPGEPSVTYDDPAAPKPAPAPPLSDYVRKIRALQSVAKPKSSFLPTIESTDPGLSQALLFLAMRPGAEAHRQVAVAYRRAGVLDYAFRHFQRAAALSTCDAPSFDGMARLWRDWGMTDLALSDAYHALRCSPSSAEVHNTLGTIFESLGRQAAAKNAYEKAVALNPRAAFAYNNLCYIELTRGNHAAASRFCQAALSLDASSVAARNNMALIEAKAGDLVGAEHRLRAGKLSASSLYNVGVLHLSEGRYREAAVVFDQAVDSQPSMTIARQRSVQARKAANAAEQAR